MRHHHIAKRIARRSAGRRRAVYRKRLWARSPSRPRTPGNLNALRHGAHAHPPDHARLTSLAAAIAREPDDLVAHLAPLIRDLHRRAPDVFRTMVALRALLVALVDHVAEILFRRELGQALHPLPLHLRDRYCERIELLAADRRPEERVSFLKKAINIRKKTHRPE
jgi:hypothetical protein